MTNVGVGKLVFLKYPSGNVYFDLYVSSWVTLTLKIRTDETHIIELHTSGLIQTADDKNIIKAIYEIK